MNDKKDKILSVAETLFNRYGLRKTTIDDIAKEAGIGKGTVYLYFSSKEEIFFAVEGALKQAFLQKVRSAVRKETKAEEQLKKFVATHFQLIDEIMTKRPMHADLLVESQVQPEYKIVRDEFFHDLSQIIRGIMEAGVENKEFNLPSIDQGVVFIEMLLRGIMSSKILLGHELLKPAAVEGMLDLALTGIKKSNKSS